MIGAIPSGAALVSSDPLARWLAVVALCSSVANLILWFVRRGERRGRKIGDL